jgi:CheY-like chemotaxis protein
MESIGIGAYLVKPVRENRLLKAVKNVLSTAVTPVEASQNSLEKQTDTLEITPALMAAETVITPQPEETPEPVKTDPLITSTQDVLKDIESALTLVAYGETSPATKIDAVEELDTKPAPGPKSVSENATPEQTTSSVTPVLVAEDFPLNQDVVRLMLQDSRYRPVFANNGREAVALFKANVGIFKAILMDVSMPVMDGYEAAELIKSFAHDKALDDIPIIALTGHALKNDRSKCLDASMDDYLTKPVKQLDLIATLDRWTGVVETKDKISA